MLSSCVFSYSSQVWSSNLVTQLSHEKRNDREHSWTKGNCVLSYLDSLRMQNWIMRAGQESSALPPRSTSVSTFRWLHVTSNLCVIELKLCRIVHSTHLSHLMPKRHFEGAVEHCWKDLRKDDESYCLDSHIDDVRKSSVVATQKLRQNLGTKKNLAKNG